MKVNKCIMSLYIVLLILLQNSSSIGQNDIQQTQRNNEEKVLDYLGLVFTGGVPIFVFVWWLLNSQQDKKHLEQNQEQNDIIDKKLHELLKNQQQGCILHQTQFNELLGRVEDKIDLLSTQFSQEKYETLRKYYDHESKLSEIIKDLARNKIMIDSVREIENYLSLRHDYKIRTVKQEKELE